ncbi:hypothetical protein D1BOALGB6SA_2806, partial [Olavius sp. associated proteobacterium Delta 1]
RMTPVITLNTVIDNAGRGIFCRATAAADIFYNDIRNNSGEGLYLAGA